MPISSIHHGGIMLARYKVAIAIIMLCLLVTATQRVYANGFTLEQIMSSPFPSDLVASKQGDKVVWIFDTQGKRNIWIAEAPEFAGRQLTHYDADDGQELSAPIFSPDGNWIAHVRGGEANSGKEIHKPT